MIKSYQDEVALKKSVAPVKAQEYATIGTVYSDGVTLIFDDSVTESTKHYLCARNQVVTAGDRVKVKKDSGTYIVESVIGAPVAQQTIGLVSNNMGYSSVTASNYLYALNNLIGILKTKYGLIL